MATATAVPPVIAGAPFAHVSVRANVEPGIKMARFVIARIAARYEGTDAVTYAEKRWHDSTPEVALALKAAVAAGTTTDATWAKPLINPQITDDFLPAAAGGDDYREDRRAAQSAVQRERAGANGRRRRRVGRGIEAEARDARWRSRWRTSGSTKSPRSSCSRRSWCGSVIRRRKRSSGIRW